MIKTKFYFDLVWPNLNSITLFMIRETPCVLPAGTQVHFRGHADDVIEGHVWCEGDDFISAPLENVNYENAELDDAETIEQRILSDLDEWIKEGWEIDPDDVEFVNRLRGGTGQSPEPGA